IPNSAQMLRRRAPDTKASSTNSTIRRRSVALVIFPRPPRSPGLFFAEPAGLRSQPAQRLCDVAPVQVLECACARPWWFPSAEPLLGQTDRWPAHNWHANDGSVQDINRDAGSILPTLLQSVRLSLAPH